MSTAASDLEPTSYYLEDVNTLGTWQPAARPNDMFCIGSVPLRSRDACRTSRTSATKILVCHDMMGGYEQDALIQGGADAGAYHFWHWSLIDIFVYFSHKMVTIPPPCWINAAHKHGVQVLGTFITEWDEGSAICGEILRSMESVQLYAQQLARICQFHRFDGWLLNIENSVAPDRIPLLIAFVSSVRSATSALCPSSQVIWYDSVTDEGELAWQDALTPRNQIFFDASDALFTNYSWVVGANEEKHPHTPSDCALLAGPRAPDVMMGVDVFVAPGRAGEGFNCTRPLHLALAAGVSAALFAPAWVYETKQGPSFEVANDRMWEGVKAVRQDALMSPPHWPTLFSLPLYSNFNQGVGHELWVEGRLVARRDWNDMSRQGLQPLLRVTIIESANRDSRVEAAVRLGCAWDGGASLHFGGAVAGGETIEVPLFDPQIDLSTTNRSLHVSFSLRTPFPGRSCQVALLLCFQEEGEGEEGQRLLLCSSGGRASAGPQAEWECGSWRISRYEVAVGQAGRRCLGGVSLVTLGTQMSTHVEACVGHVRISDRSEEECCGRFGLRGLRWGDVGEGSGGEMGATLRWDVAQAPGGGGRNGCGSCRVASVDVYLVGGEGGEEEGGKKWVGSAFVSCYRLVIPAVGRRDTAIVVQLQPSTSCGARLPLRDCFTSPPLHFAHG